MRKLAIIVLVCICYGKAGAQLPIDKDSLLRLLPVAREDTAKVQLLIDIGNQYEWDDHETAATYYLKARRLSEKLNYKRGKIKFAASYTSLLNWRGLYDSSMVYNREALDLSIQLNDKLLIGRSSANLGNVFLNLGNYDSAVHYYETALKNFEAIGDAIRVARLYDLLQITYYELHQHEKALYYGKQAIAVLRNSNDPASLCGVLSNAGNNYYKLLQYDTALAYYREALSLAKKVNSKSMEISLMLNFGNLYTKTLQIDSIRPYMEKAVVLSREMRSPETEAKANRGLAHYYLFKNDLDAAYKHISHALEITEKNNFRQNHLSNLETLSGILLAMQRYKESYRVQLKAEALSDSLTGDDIQHRTLLLSKQFETEKKEAQIQLQQAQLKQKNTLNYILIGGAVALSVISLLSYRNYHHKQKLQQAKIEELETEKQLTATEAILKGEEQERTRLAKDLHDGLGGMLSGIKYSFQNMKENLILTPENARAFERSLDMLDSSIKEMRRVAHNMMPEMLVKYGLNMALREFCNEIDRSGVIRINYQSIGMNNSSIEQITAITVYRIVQELVNNAIKHAAASQMVVQLQLSGQILTVTVEDNGKGFDTALLQSARGIGWRSIRNRVDFLKGTIDVRSTPDMGTSVLMEVALS